MNLGLEVEQAQFFRARAELEPVKIALEPASSPSFLLIKMQKFKDEPTSSLLEKVTCRASGLFTESQNFGPGLWAWA